MSKKKKLKPSKQRLRFPEIAIAFEEEKDRIQRSSHGMGLFQTETKYLSEITRSLSVIYGFFFVLLSAILGVLPYLVTLSEFVRVNCYCLIWIFSLSMIIVGGVLNSSLVTMGISQIGSIGLQLLGPAVNLSFLLFVGTVIADNIFISGFSLAFLGLITFIGLLFLTSIVFAFQLRKYRRSKELLEQKETDYFKTIIKLMKKVDTPEKMEEIIAYYTDVPRFYTNKSFQEEIAKALIRFNGHKGIIAEVKRCSKFLDNFEIRRALRETAA